MVLSSALQQTWVQKRHALVCMVKVASPELVALVTPPDRSDTVELMEGDCMQVKLLLVILAHHSTPPSMLMSSVVFDELEPP